MHENRIFWKRAIPVCILLICIIVSFAVYLDTNRVA